MHEFVKLDNSKHVCLQVMQLYKFHQMYFLKTLFRKRISFNEKNNKICEKLIRILFTKKIYISSSISVFNNFNTDNIHTYPI